MAEGVKWRHLPCVQAGALERSAICTVLLCLKSMMLEQELQWGSAVLRRRSHPLLALLRTECGPWSPPAAGQGCRRLGAHAVAVSAVALHRSLTGPPVIVRCGQLRAGMRHDAC